MPQGLEMELDSQQQFIQTETSDALKSAELSIKVLLSVIDKLKKFVAKNKFKTCILPLL